MKRAHWNYSQGKVASYKAALKLNFEYADYMEKYEEIYRNVYNMTALNKQLRLKTIAAGDKGSGSSNLEPNIHEEEAARRLKEETARRLA